MSKKLLLIDIDDTICNASEAYNIALLKCFEFLKRKYPLLDKKHFLQTYRKAREQIHLELGGTASMHNRFLYFQRLFEIFGLYSVHPYCLFQLFHRWSSLLYRPR